MSLPLELEFSFGMRKYQALITEERGILPKFSREGGRYVLPGLEEEGVGQQLGSRFTHQVPSADKGKQKIGTSPVDVGVADEETRGLVLMGRKSAGGGLISLS